MRLFQRQYCPAASKSYRIGLSANLFFRTTCVSSSTRSKAFLHVSGIAGAIAKETTDWGALTERMAMSLSYSSSDHVNRWQDEQLALCRVDCGFRGGDTQPIFSSDNIHCLMMYGEVYDYERQKKQLAAQGHRVRNDAEFCLALYREQGEKAFTTLNGSFCIVLANLKKRQLLLVTDRLSSRSFFYSQDPKGTLIFGSQVSALLNLPNIDRELDVAAVIEFFTLQRVYGEKTYYKGVKWMPPASILRYSEGNISISSYWKGVYNPEQRSLDDYAEELATLLKQAVKRITEYRKNKLPFCSNQEIPMEQ